MRVAIVDPSGFTLPYDHCLAASLAQQACQVVLVTTCIPQGSWVQCTAYEHWAHFYMMGNRLNKSKVRTYVKGCEHTFDMERLLYLLRRWKPDIIHFQWLPFPAVDGFFLRRFSKICPLVLTVHDTEPFHGAPSSRLQLMGLVPAFKRFDHYIVHTQYSKKALVSQLGLLEERISIIPHGVFTYYRGLVNDLAKSCRISQLAGKKRILFFGVLKPYKGVDILLEAFSHLPQPMAKETILQIVGYPKMAVKPLKALAHRLNIGDRVLWDLRFVEEVDVAAYFSQADVVVLPYRRIDQSGVLMTALAFGKPIVASRVGGFVEIIKNGIHGFLVEPGDPEALARVLACVLGDDELRARIAGAVERLVSEELSWDNIAKRTVCLYQDIVKVKGRIPG